MFTKYPRLHRREEAEDVFQEAMIRLWQSLEEVGPTTVAAFMGLAALQMRRALRDLARRHFGRRNAADQGVRKCRPATENLAYTLENEPGDSTWHPHDLACWSEFHAAADRLPEPERTAFDLLYYHELPQTDVADLMQVSERQVRRYWQTARRELHRELEGFLPKT
jgi:RNA polymerase sigma-70 factor (ECF subfamily)